MIDATPGQRAYRISRSSPTRTYFREIEVVRVTPAQIIARTKMRQELRFWRKNGYEVGTGSGGVYSVMAHFSAGPLVGDHYVEAGCDRGREWPNA